MIKHVFKENQICKLELLEIKIIIKFKKALDLLNTRLNTINKKLLNWNINMKKLFKMQPRDKNKWKRE